MEEYTFRSRSGRMRDTFEPKTTLRRVAEVLSVRLGTRVAGFLVGFPPRPVKGDTLEGVSTNEIVTLVEGSPQVSVITIKEEPQDEAEYQPQPGPSPQATQRPVPRPYPATVLDAKRLIATEISHQKIAQKVICKVILGVSQGRLCQLMQDTVYDNMIIGQRPYPNKSCEHYHKMYEFLTTRSVMERHNLYCAAAWGIERERQQKRHAPAIPAEPPTDARSPLLYNRKAFGRGKRTFISDMAKRKMENYFVNISRFITQDSRAMLAQQLNLPEETVQFYFKNLRAREKKGSFIPHMYDD